jgi:hypothetical protein
MGAVHGGQQTGTKPKPRLTNVQGDSVKEAELEANNHFDFYLNGAIRFIERNSRVLAKILFLGH